MATKYYVLIKRKGSKNYLGAIPSKSGVSLAKLRSTVSKQIKSGFSYKIVTSSGLKNLLKNLKPKRTVKRRTVKKRVARRKVAKKRRRKVAKKRRTIRRTKKKR